MTLPEYALVRVRHLLYPPAYYNGITQRPPQVGETGYIVDMMRSSKHPTSYTVEAFQPDGTTLWLCDFLEEELELIDAYPLNRARKPKG